MDKTREIMNVEGVTGRYTREHYTRDMFKEVTTPYNYSTRNLELLIQRKVLEAKDITRVFKNLTKKGYTITTIETVLGGEHHIPCYNTEIGGVFNGNVRVVNILWGTPSLDRVDMGYKQNIYAIIK